MQQGQGRGDSSVHAMQGCGWVWRTGRKAGCCQTIAREQGIGRRWTKEREGRGRTEVKHACKDYEKKGNRE